MMVYMDIGFKKLSSIHDWRAIETNRCLQEKYILEWMTKGNPAWSNKIPEKNNLPKLTTHNVPTYDAENSVSIN